MAAAAAAAVRVASVLREMSGDAEEVEPDDDETPQHEYCAPTAARDDYTATRTARPRWTRAVAGSTTQAR